MANITQCLLTNPEQVHDEIDRQGIYEYGNFVHTLQTIPNPHKRKRELPKEPQDEPELKIPEPMPAVQVKGNGSSSSSSASMVLEMVESHVENNASDPKHPKKKRKTNKKNQTANYIPAEKCAAFEVKTRKEANDSDGLFIKCTESFEGHVILSIPKDEGLKQEFSGKSSKELEKMITEDGREKFDEQRAVYHWYASSKRPLACPFNAQPRREGEKEYKGSQNVHNYLRRVKRCCGVNRYECFCGKQYASLQAFEKCLNRCNGAHSAKFSVSNPLQE